MKTRIRRLTEPMSVTLPRGFWYLLAALAVLKAFNTVCEWIIG